MYSVIRNLKHMRWAITAALFTVCILPAIAQSGTPSPWKSVEDAMGRTGQAQPGDVMKFAMPRKDLHVTLNGVEIKAGLALGSWIAFKMDHAGAMAMGDLVLLEAMGGGFTWASALLRW